MSYEDLRRLKEGQPIKFNLKELGLQNMTVLIFAEKTEEIMTDLILDIIDKLKHCSNCAFHNFDDERCPNLGYTKNRGYCNNYIIKT